MIRFLPVLTRTDAEVNKWRVATGYTVFSLVLQLATIYHARNLQGGNYGYIYLGRWPHWSLATAAVLIVLALPVIAWRRSPLLRAIVAEEYRLIKLWGSGCIYVRMSEQEAKVFKAIPVKHKAMKIGPKRAYSGVERRKRA